MFIGMIAIELFLSFIEVFGNMLITINNPVEILEFFVVILPLTIIIHHK